MAQARLGGRNVKATIGVAAEARLQHNHFKLETTRLNPAGTPIAEIAAVPFRGNGVVI